ncbi:hypothetical protein HWV62_17426 [Athelia sp. TMB]|nr:hypothetical protein HWV62_17426 [Athelia sp. TMB]
MTDPLNNLRLAYHALERKVIRALHTQVGDGARLRLQQHEVLSFVEVAAVSTQHRNLFNAEEYGRLQTNVNSMVAQLDAACYRSTDDPDGPSLVVAKRVRTGKRGRPRLHIDPAFLREALSLRGPTGIAPVLACCSRTVRRRAIEHGLVVPARPVFQATVLPDGNITRSYNVPAAQPPPAISDEALDAMVLDVLTVFPAFGRSMLAGHLAARGQSVHRDRLRASYIRVHGAPVAWGNRVIDRRGYNVAGANSLWHHDGQHGLSPILSSTAAATDLIAAGLIKYKMVQHCFIDGKGRFVVGIKVNNNNRASTVLKLFKKSMRRHGVPSRVRGDHGTENLKVAAWMEEHRGAGRGSYIWGRSVHNTRIERLWFDVTHGYGQKWKNFFYDLETHHSLNPQVPQHIWLLHHLFLDAVDQDAQDWARAWNSHKLQIKGERTRSPRDIFIFSLIQDGPRGLQHQSAPPTDQTPIDPESYGVDWDVANDERYMAHLFEQNPQEWAHDNPFSTAPVHQAHVPCEAPNCPFDAEEVRWLDETLAETVSVSARAMHLRRLVWIKALQLCDELWNLVDTDSVYEE